VATITLPFPDLVLQYLHWVVRTTERFLPSHRLLVMIAIGGDERRE